MSSARTFQFIACDSHSVYIEKHSLALGESWCDHFDLWCPAPDPSPYFPFHKIRQHRHNKGLVKAHIKSGQARVLSHQHFILHSDLGALKVEYKNDCIFQCLHKHQPLKVLCSSLRLFCYSNCQGCVKGALCLLGHWQVSWLQSSLEFFRLCFELWYLVIP